jgi:hypothetical protein
LSANAGRRPERVTTKGEKYFLSPVQFLLAFTHHVSGGGHTPPETLRKERLTMGKSQLSKETPGGVLSIRKRQVFWTRFFILVLFLALNVMSAQPKASADVADKAVRGEKASVTSRQPRAAAPNCPACQQAYVECMAGGGANCAAQYNACLSGCQ